MYQRQRLYRSGMRMRFFLFTRMNLRPLRMSGWRRQSRQLTPVELSCAVTVRKAAFPCQRKQNMHRSARTSGRIPVRLMHCTVRSSRTLRCINKPAAHTVPTLRREDKSCFRPKISAGITPLTRQSDTLPFTACHAMLRTRHYPLRPVHSNF